MRLLRHHFVGTESGNGSRLQGAREAHNLLRKFRTLSGGYGEHDEVHLKSALLPLYARHLHAVHGQAREGADHVPDGVGSTHCVLVTVGQLGVDSHVHRTVRLHDHRRGGFGPRRRLAGGVLDLGRGRGPFHPRRQAPGQKQAHVHENCRTDLLNLGKLGSGLQHTQRRPGRVLAPDPHPPVQPHRHRRQRRRAHSPSEHSHMNQLRVDEKSSKNRPRNSPCDRCGRDVKKSKKRFTVAVPDEGSDRRTTRS
mmetsp:Transcript_50043/g.109425  ORF Transcript_50043/g.109425 Transcript_50043/m.109425 type:complete len:252 (-) Transcript_50043:156-911(-)